MTNEQFYDETIAPELARLADQCRIRGMSLVALVEFAEGQAGSTVQLQPSHSWGTFMAALAARSYGNVDGLIMGIMRKARTTGHNSLCLLQLGVSCAPSSPDTGGVVQ